MKTRCTQKLIDLANVAQEPGAEQRNEISLWPQCHVPEDRSAQTVLKAWSVPTGFYSPVEMQSTSFQRTATQRGKFKARAFRSQRPRKAGRDLRSDPKQAAAAIPAWPRFAEPLGFWTCSGEEAFLIFFSLTTVEKWFLILDQSARLISTLSENPSGGWELLSSLSWQWK